MTALDDSAVRGFDEQPLAELGKPLGRSVTDVLREKYAGPGRTKDLPIPRYTYDDGSPMLIGRYRVLASKELLRIGRESKTLIAQGCALLAAACDELLIRDEKGRTHSLAEYEGLPGKVKFDGKLAELLGIPAEQAATAPDVVFFAYGEDTPILGHSDLLTGWMTGKDLSGLSEEEIDASLGEAPAAT